MTLDLISIQRAGNVQRNAYSAHKKHEKKYTFEKLIAALQPEVSKEKSKLQDGKTWDIACKDNQLKVRVYNTCLFYLL